MKRDRKRNLILIASLLAFALLLFLAVRLARGGEEGKTFEILLDGESFGRYSLLSDAEIPVKDLCVVSVSGGAVFVSSSVCPNQTCVRHAPIRGRGETIVCLPNRLVIRIGGEGETDFML